MNSQFRTAEPIKRPTHLYPTDVNVLTLGDSFGQSLGTKFSVHAPVIGHRCRLAESWARTDKFCIFTAEGYLVKQGQNGDMVIVSNRKVGHPKAEKVPDRQLFIAMVSKRNARKVNAFAPATTAS